MHEGMIIGVTEILRQPTGHASSAARSSLASGSLMNSCLTGSYFRFRCSHMQILAACTVVMARCIASG